MILRLSTEVQELIAQHMASGEYADENQLLRVAPTSLAEQDNDWLAIKQALDEVEQGDDGRSLEETFAAIRIRHNIP